MSAARIVGYAVDAGVWQTAPNPLVTGSFSWQAGDIVLFVAGSAANGASVVMPTVTGLTLSVLPGFPVGNAASVQYFAWRADPTSSGSGTASAVTSGGTTGYGMSVFVLRGSIGFGTPAFSIGGSPSVVTLNRGGNDSLVISLVGDWNATNDTTIVPVPAGGATKRVGAFLTGQWTAFVHDYPSQGAAGSASYGIGGFSGTGGTGVTVCAIEVLGNTDVDTVVSFGENTGNTSGIDDAQIKEADTTTNFGSSTSFEISEFGIGDATRTLFKATGFPGSIPSGKFITEARLRLYCEMAGGIDHTLEFYDLKAAFVEAQATWNIRSTGNNWATAGANNTTSDRSATAIASLASMSAATGYRDFPFTAAGIAWLQALLDGGATNHGFIGIRTVGAAMLEFRLFTSSEGTNGQRPILEVTYGEPPVILPWVDQRERQGLVPFQQRFGRR